MTSVWDIVADIIDPPDDTWRPLPHQIAPAGEWFTWILMGGRGAGKTATAARHIHEHVMGPPCLPDMPGGHWVGIIAPTLGDAVTSCVTGPSGLRVHDPAMKLRQTAGGTTVRWSNGAEGKLFGAHSPEDIERLRSGGNRCVVWAEELAAWRYMQDCWEHMRYGLRVGPHPHVVVSTTPKNRKLIKELVTKALTKVLDPDTGEIEVVMTKATTMDNPHLDKRVKRMLIEDYGNTRMGRQELYAEILDDNQNALWTEPIIEAGRILQVNEPEHYDRKVVAIDPAVGGANEHGIVVCGAVAKWQHRADSAFSHMPQGFVIDDLTCVGSPNEWARKAIGAFKQHRADYVVAEKNNGGDMVQHTIQSLDPGVPVKLVWASRGKAKRAEPISMLYEQGRIHHIGNFPELEDQMCEYDADEPDESWSPDRMDAMVWGFHELLVGGQDIQNGQVRDTRLRHRR